MSKKLGVTKPKGKIHEKIHAETVEHPHVPGRAFEFDNAADKLIAMIGGGFFNEPKYYDENRSYGEFFNELINTGKISSVITDEMGLSAQAKEVVETAQAVAKSANPEDLLVIASWARDTKTGLKLRYTPQIMACIAAANDSTKKYLPKYATSIVQRADEIINVFAAFRHLFSEKKDGMNKGTLPASLRKFLSIAFANQSLYGLLKYDSASRPNFKDVLLMIRGAFTKNSVKKYTKNNTDNGWPLSKPVYEYFVNGTISDDAPDMLKMRKKFFSLTDIKDVTDEMLEKAGLTWENVISQFGGTKEAWELIIPQMNEMALTRNLRNFEETKISEAAWDKVYEKCTSIKDTKQLPFRFFTASKEISSTNSQSINDKMLDNACMNVPELSGTTVIFVDNSGSAQGAAISGKSNMRVSDTGNTLAAVIAKRMGRKAMIGVFGDSLMWVPFSESDSCMAIKKQIDKVAKEDERSKHNALAVTAAYKKGRGVGGGTETGLWCGIHDLTERKVVVDRIIICSDFCCYTIGGANNCGYDMNQYFGKGGEKATIESMLETYRRKVNSKLWTHSIDLAGYGKAQVKPKQKQTQTLSGWSEQIFGLIKDFEDANNESQQSSTPVEVPTIAILRKRYAKSDEKKSDEGLNPNDTQA